MHVVMLSFSPIRDDARLRRHGDALAAAGYRVTAVGLPGGRAVLPPWRVIDLSEPRSTRGWLRPLIRGARIGSMALCRWFPMLCETIYWRQALTLAMAEAADFLDGDVYVANDWLTLPIAARLAASRGVPFLYDSHEYAVEEGADRMAWRLLVAPYVHAVEARHIHRAARVVTVGDGIARLLQADHRLSVPPVVVRNAVPLDLQPFRPCGDGIEVLYQGLLRDDRGLATLIRSVPLWRPEFRLVIRGPGETKVVAGLKALAEALAPERIRFDPPVAPPDMVAAANASDIGIHPIPPTSNQTRYCLPNKFFEYAMAGLALCVSESAEMSALLRAHALGEVITHPTPEATAAAVNAFTRERVETAKRNALRAASQLSWEEESLKLIALFPALSAKE